MSNTKNKPIRTLRDGQIKAVIWKNQSEDGGAFYSVEFVRSYRDSQDNWHDTSSFSNGQLLKVAHLATKAYDAIAALKAKDAKAEDQAHD